MQIEPIGYLGYKLYRLGWQSAVRRHLAPANHLLLSIFLYYRRGFTDGLVYIRNIDITSIYLNLERN